MTETAAAAPETGIPRDERTIARLWRDGVAAGRSRPAYLVESDEGWRDVSWTDADRRVRDYANGLLARGIGESDWGAAVIVLALPDLDALLSSDCRDDKGGDRVDDPESGGGTD